MDLRRLMAAKGLTVSELSDLSGILPREIEQFIGSNHLLRSARTNVLVSLANALGVQPRDLLQA